MRPSSEQHKKRHQRVLLTNKAQGVEMLNYGLVCKDLHTVADLGGGLAADRTHQMHQLSVKLTMFIVGVAFVNYPVS